MANTEPTDQGWDFWAEVADVAIILEPLPDGQVHVTVTGRGVPHSEQEDTPHE